MRAEPTRVAAVLDAVSPELALVCPELRDWAIATLPERDPWSFLNPSPAAERDVPEAAAAIGAPRAPRLAAALLYFVVALACNLLSSSIFVAAFVIVMFVMSL